ncbi:MAG: FAD-binding oxidoreductase [Thermoanaerobaculia bacterium]
MRRWNGWGDETVTVALPPRAISFLTERIGAGTTPRDASFAEALGRVPPPRIRADGLDANPVSRLAHARGQSLPDWIALRSGHAAPFPDLVAWPESESDVRELIELARRSAASLIPFGGGTSVLGQVNPLAGSRPSISVDLSRLSVLKSLDVRSHLATFGAGVRGPDLEAALRAHGFTLGHFPQSFEHSTLGGWVATRSCGQQSLGYGRIERLFAGGRMETPAGPFDLPVFPASAAGPDLREIVLGSEGRLGILTEATVRVSSLPEREEFLALFFAEWEAGLTATRAIAQARLPLSMLRLASPKETEATLVLAGHERSIDMLRRYLRIRLKGETRCLLLASLTGRRSVVRSARRELLALSRSHGGVFVGTALGEEWRRSRFRAPYLRNALWEAGYAVDTLETAVPWSALPSLHASVESALGEGLRDIAERVHVFSHLSHLYADGSSLYTTYLFRLVEDPDENLRRWRHLKAAASRAIVEARGTISHQHGVGVDHLPYLGAEKGPLGLAALGSICRQFDPEGLMNPGKLVP